MKTNTMNNQQTFYWKPVNSEKDLPEDNIIRIYRWDHAGNPEWQRIDLYSSDSVKRWQAADKFEYETKRLEYLSEAIPEPAQGLDTGEVEILREGLQSIIDYSITHLHLHLL